MTSSPPRQARFLATPNVGRSRHFHTSAGREKRARVQTEKGRLLCVMRARRRGERNPRRVAFFFGEPLAERVLARLVCSAVIGRLYNAISAATEELKAAGMPGNEAARIRHFANGMMSCWETLRMIKRYRTVQARAGARAAPRTPAGSPALTRSLPPPQTTRSFARLMIFLHTFLMGPYYAYIAGAGFQGGEGSSRVHTNYAFALFLAVSTSLALSALFNIRRAHPRPSILRLTPDLVSRAQLRD